MSTQPSGAVATDEVEPECWCCGQPFDRAEMVALGSHPEVTVCFRCASFLHRQARARRDAARPSPGARARAVVAKTRGYVIVRGWHRNRVVGPALRWLGDRLP